MNYGKPPTRIHKENHIVTKSVTHAVLDLSHTLNERDRLTEGEWFVMCECVGNKPKRFVLECRIFPKVCV